MSDLADRLTVPLSTLHREVVRSRDQWDRPADALVAQIRASPHVVVLDMHGSAHVRWFAGREERPRSRH